MLLLGSANTMKINTAFCFVLSGWVLVSANARSRWQRRLRLSCLGIVVVIASLTLLQHVTGWNLGIDELLIRDRISLWGLAGPGA